MASVRTYYKILRSILFTAIILVVLIYSAIYVLFSVPAFKRFTCKTAEKELTALLGGEVAIGDINFYPFNELRLSDVVVKTPENERFVSIETLGAGIHLWRLIADRKVEITYAEIIGLDGRIWQQEENEPLNIQFLIDAFAPKDKNKPPAKFDLKIHNVVIRRSRLSFDRRWKPADKYSRKIFDPDHIHIYDLKADVTLPQLKNDDFIIDLRRIAFMEHSGLNLQKLSLKTHITNKSISVNNLTLNIGNSKIRTSDFSLNFNSFSEIKQALENGDHSIEVVGEDLMPSDFKAFLPQLESINAVYTLQFGANGNMKSLNLSELMLKERSGESRLKLEAYAENIDNFKESEIAVGELNLNATRERIRNILDAFCTLEPNVNEMISRVGDVSLKLKGDVSLTAKAANSEINLSTSLGDLKADANMRMPQDNKLEGKFSISTQEFDLGHLLNNAKLGFISTDLDGNISKAGKNIDGSANMLIEYIDYNSRRFNNISVELEKSSNNYLLTADASDEKVIFNLDGNARIEGSESEYSINADLDRLRLADLGINGKFSEDEMSGSLAIEMTGNNLDNLLGEARIRDFTIKRSVEKELYIQSATANLTRRDSIRDMNFESDFLNFDITGNFRTADIAPCVKSIAAYALPTFIDAPQSMSDMEGDIALNIDIKPYDALYNFFSLPVRPLKDIDITGKLNMKDGVAELTTNAPYILQGNNKLISNVNLNLYADKLRGAVLNVMATYPIKNDRANIDTQFTAYNGRLFADLGWQMVNNKSAEGNVSFDVDLVKNPETGSPEAEVMINHSTFHLGPADWTIGKSKISYADKRVSVDGLRIWHDNQYVEIDGSASESPEDEVSVKLADIDLKYIFDILNINYVSFGGIATGEVTASEVFSKLPVARTRRLHVENLSYNDAVLGNAELSSRWNNEEKEVEIYADIKDGNVSGAVIDGGVYVTRDSLSFDMDANKVRIEFLKPFMSAFTSDVGGRASGQMKLFGTFKDIDLVGKAFADSISMKVDYTNVYYHGSDSVYLNPGRIEIPGFKLYDKYGNSANLTGYVKHRYFHDPEFEFKISDARNLLCYDTNAQINLDWYGKIYASGGGSLIGRPGIVALTMEMTASRNSEFTFVLSETLTAADYTFLTFSDKRKEALESLDIEESFEEKFRKKQEEVLSRPTVFTMDLRATVNPDSKFVLVMDPAAGDKVVAHGNGSLQLSYDTESEEIKMLGSYTIQEGKYNFSLQELILKEFDIRAGSEIKFIGDPLNAELDITAAYRVNTNLSDLDKSFASDRDLNRTNVPVDALIIVKGDLKNPVIDFDISLPTLTSDVERKVKSIISTDEMMNRQIIYLLALNRFYTPEYMGSSSNGGELASVASSTISSQLSNIVGQLTDKVTLSPSFRSDKGDFSDMEVDLSLSSRLLNNRLLINGNFGYRDRSTSQTTFVGDFDIEYLLSRNGNLRLKAYNHFNDQYYYLRSALTTQGIGIIYKKEFDNPFTFLRRKKKKDAEKDEKKVNDSNGEALISVDKEEEEK